MRDSRLPQRFWEKIEINDNGCWLWTGAKNSQGYGHMLVGSRTDNSRRYVKVHRLAYERLVGKISAPHLDHLCRQRDCANPAHLQPVTAKINVRRGQGHGSEPECPYGHPYDEHNTYRHAGKRFCRKCNANRWIRRARRAGGGESPPEEVRE